VRRRRADLLGMAEIGKELRAPAMHGFITAVLFGLIIGLVWDVSDLRCRIDGGQSFSFKAGGCVRN
jgi:hypothetical protein